MEGSNFPNMNPFDEDALSFICSPILSEHEEWTFEEDKLFEKALAMQDMNNSEDVFEEIATKVPGKTIEQIKNHLEVLVEDVKLIESDGNIASSNYKTTDKYEHGTSSNTQTTSIHQQKKKGTRWTKEEHEKFLIGLNRYGKGDWRSISRNCVLTKTPTQVASHAQKYFIRLAKSSSAAAATTSKAQKLSTMSQDSPRIMASSSTQFSAATSAAAISFQATAMVTSRIKQNSD